MKLDADFNDVFSSNAGPDYPEDTYAESRAHAEDIIDTEDAAELASFIGAVRLAEIIFDWVKPEHYVDELAEVIDQGVVNPIIPAQIKVRDAIDALRRGEPNSALRMLETIWDADYRRD